MPSSSIFTTAAESGKLTAGPYDLQGFLVPTLWIVAMSAIGLAPAIRRNPERFPAIVIFPQARPDNLPGWQLDGGKIAMLALERGIKEFRGDPKRVVLTGYSAGGRLSRVNGSPRGPMT